ncbi:cupin domain-containing protein [Microbacterium sp. SORGH_AS_0888]|uniref:cupin domain-containing protein n=1 Tax=Microbacterium sp. SORGH_AS_0888 TaxID=3041791 RepID=UPI00278222E3|nr:cupin domain-containing protein [Microbacterium sp. SORGH_AS_0888]MDQ1128138.1 mannose-6-phosphate isomerase-like protein (cupin superfamily) [Microbacterium sp. SORGH_AS_0888]
MTDEVVTAVSRAVAEHYVWGEVSDGWRLLDEGGLSVIEERVPAGEGEEWHVHDVARQFFYVLDGRAEMQTQTGTVPLVAGEGVQVEPGRAHRFFNPSDSDVRFLVVSAPSTRGDRRSVEFRFNV